MTTTQVVGGCLLLGMVVLLTFCMSKPREKITLKQFCHELWEGDPSARWFYWMIIWMLIWKL
jgi:hypothetical protein